jgi:2-C-methyl-D-erythritol 4-phosphate cytidylyltransferase
MRITAIILAAGQGRRMNLPVAKQFLNIQGKPMIYYSLKTFENSKVDEIILVTGKDQVEYCKNLISDYSLTKVSKVIVGGCERYDSVYNALVSIEKADYVLIHDGARPFITVEKIADIIDAVIEYKACIIGTPVKETIKIADKNGFISGTPSRNSLWAAQTPQAFDYKLIKKAYDLYYSDTKNAPNVTDDAMVYEIYTNSKVKILQGDYNNIKVTTPEDIPWAEQIAIHYFNL